MSRRVLLPPDVPNDLHEIVAYLDSCSFATSDRFVQSVSSAFDDLAEVPGKGSPKQFRSRLLNGVRSWSVPGFRNILILYRVIPDAIDILAVTHGSRNLRRLLLK